jgi:ATP-binding cassette subfamily C (CFTR/MRP) protein 10
VQCSAAARVFTTLALINILISPLNALPWVVNGMMEAVVSMQRVSDFLQQDEVDPVTYYSAGAV